MVEIIDRWLSLFLELYKPKVFSPKVVRKACISVVLHTLGEGTVELHKSVKHASASWGMSLSICVRHSSPPR